MMGGHHERASLACLGAAVVLAGSAAGAVHTPVLLAVSTLIGVAALVNARALAPSPMTWTLLALSAVCVGQALPLPMGLVRALSPNVADVWQRTLAVTDEASRFASLSLAPGASLIEALKFASYALAATVASTWARRHGPWAWVAWLLASGVVLALTTLVTLFFGVETLWGLHRPRFAERALPILNPNTLAGCLNLATFAGFALLLRAERAEKTLLFAAGATLCLATSLLLASRGATLALGLALLLSALCLLRDRARATETGPRSPRSWVMVAVVAAGVCLLWLAAKPSTWAMLASGSVVKLSVFAGTLALIADHPWLGVGRGAFETAFPPYRPEGARVYTANSLFTHPENIVLQWFAEWGVVITLLAVAGLGLALARRRMIDAHPRARSVFLIGLCGVFLHNLVDLGSEVPALALVTFASLGAFFPGRRERGESAPTGRWQRFLPMAALVALLCAVAIVQPQRAIDLRDSFYQRLQHAGSDAERAALASDISRALHGVPGDPYLLMLGAHAWQGRDEGRSFRYAARALERDPRHGPAHLRIAEVLYARGAHSQALLELRLAVQAWPELAERAAQRERAWRRAP